jgi:hypothetical protein
MNDVLRLNGFVAWLYDHATTAIIGFNHDEVCNPVATYLRYHDHEAVVFNRFIFVEGDPPTAYNTPAWVTCFLDDLDAITPYDTAITTEVALRTVSGLTSSAIREVARYE